MIKIAITGPESSGKTTIAQQLAEHFNCCLTKEYAREHLNNKDGKYTMDDLIKIAEKQYSLNRGKDCGEKILICDTEMTVIKIWAMDKFGYCPGEIISLHEQQKFDLIFLCKPDIPWEADPLREDENRRKFLFNLYREELFLEDEDFEILEGSRETRFHKALNIIDSISE